MNIGSTLYQTAVKKYLYEMLKEKYTNHQQIIERITSTIVTEKDVKDFGDFIATLYETAYMRAVNEYKGIIEKMGYTIGVHSKEN